MIHKNFLFRLCIFLIILSNFNTLSCPQLCFCDANNICTSCVSNAILSG